ncbi:hypothetical protein QEH52_09885 [Coraliomargarita sp. SDUM461003]|uniref:PAS fold-4 domain-containing protein n=1 Tax=Thalassobacterium maritimum TaxID=3041265 RepID=A0ABU1AUH9_9BACT|nr:hypothetical protein [Coraliomargarita sp. SDUM461003]MBT62858.1 hypothetical protein [Puniceicoccaceae bacterium]MDQ8207821.1 hypothetical protein [Coraliomargarita sp. SDUM461003]
MNSTDHQGMSFSALLLALTTGVFSCIAIATVLIVLGVTDIEAYVFAGLGGVTVSCFVWIERSLTSQLREKERLLTLAKASSLEAQNQLYSRSLACFVRFDAGSLIIDRASPGFVKMLRMPTDSVLRGQRLEEVLGVNPLKLESVVDSIKQGDASVKQPKIEMKSADGFSTHALLSGQYFEKEHVVEAAFFVPPVKNAERVADLEAAQKDLDRFRKGMFRRETRILELKEEVNLLCREAGEAPRYKTDNSSDDSKLELPVELVESLPFAAVRKGSGH